MVKTSAHFDVHDPFSVQAAREELRKDNYPAVNQNFVPHSKRTIPARYGAGYRDSKADESRKFEGGGDAARLRELEMQLEIEMLKQANSQEGVRA